MARAHRSLFLSGLLRSFIQSEQRLSRRPGPFPSRSGQRIASAGMLIGAIAMFVSVNLEQPGSCQETTKAAADDLDEVGMAAELARLDGICERLSLSDERQVMRRWPASEPTDANLLYLPVDIDPLAAGLARRPAEAKAAHANWLKHFTRARQRHARYWVAEAKRQVADGDEWSAYQSLWRAVREDSDNVEAKHALSPLLLAMTVRAKPVVSRVADPQLSWPAGSFSKLDTANFQILSRADAATTISIAQRLERFYALWTQVFYPLWAPPDVIGKRLAGRGINWGPRREFKIAVCKDRREYLAALEVAESNAEVSVGYYNAGSRLSLFYPSEQLEVTLFHELTHQLLAEGSSLRSNQGGKYERDFWLVEGIALYMESLVDLGDHWRVGGWTAPRLQSARYRALHDGYWVDWEKFTASGMEQWKVDPEISQLYTQATGLTHYFLDKRWPDHADSLRSGESSKDSQPGFDADASRAALLAALIAVYSFDKGDGRLLELLGGPAAQENYVRFLLVRDGHLKSVSDGDAGRQSSTDLVLTRSQLSTEAWQRAGQFRKLKWLDVSFSNATSPDLKWLEKLVSLERLSLEGTAIDASTIQALARLPQLKELDLSECSIDDAALAPLRSASSLETLWLSKTKVSAASAGLIESLPRLTFVALDQTQMPAAEAERLSQRIQSRRRK